MTSFERARREMVRRHIVPRGVRDEKVLRAMASVPRERFVPASMVEHAYDDTPLPIAWGQTVSQPYVVAHMAEMARVSSGARVLEVGTGSGYAAAVLGRLAKVVYTIERHPELFAAASRVLRDVGARNVLCALGDGTLGLPSAAPFDAIVVAAAGSGVPRALLEQLTIGGHLVLPVGPPGRQTLERVTRLGEWRYVREALSEVRFVPLIGAGA